MGLFRGSAFSEPPIVGVRPLRMTAFGDTHYSVLEDAQEACLRNAACTMVATPGNGFYSLYSGIPATTPDGAAGWTSYPIRRQ